MAVRTAWVADANDPRVVDFRDLTDVAARSATEPAEGLFIAEGEKVIRRALANGYQVRSVLTEPRWLPALEPALAGAGAGAGAAVLLAEPAVLRGITGYRVHRGALAAMARRPLPTVESLVVGARLLVVLVDLVDHTNVGAVFRSAAALGADAVLVSPGCADPLYRRAVKVSMGAVLSVPWTRTGPDPLAGLGGATTVALTPDPGARDIRDAALDRPPVALLLGTEGDGLPSATMDRADVRVRIPMAPGADSLNVAAASAIAIHEILAGWRARSPDSAVG